MATPEQAKEHSEEAPAQAPEGALVKGLIFNGVTLGLIALVGWATDTWVNALISVAVNWIVFAINAYPFASEKFFDATGTVTYVTLIISALAIETDYFQDFGRVVLRQWVFSGMVLVWSIRLGSYLLARICRDGKDARFDSLKLNFVLWLGVWSMQALWCYLITLPVLITLSKVTNPLHTATASVTIWDIVGWSIWVFAFAFEVIADRQKDAWRQLPENKGRFITVGLWSRSRHPNYFGEITIWIGVCISCFSDFMGVDFLGWLSPLTTFVLLNYVSGVPLLEASSDKKWGDEPEYQHYKAVTPCVFPRLTAPPPFGQGEVPLANTAA